MKPKVATFHAHNSIALDEMINAYIESLGYIREMAVQLQVVPKGNDLNFIAMVTTCEK